MYDELRRLARQYMVGVCIQSGRLEMYIQPYPGPGAREQISVDGGTAPAWSHDGRELLYDRYVAAYHRGTMRRRGWCGTGSGSPFIA